MDELCGEVDDLTGCTCQLDAGHSSRHISREDLTELHWDTPVVDALVDSKPVEPPDVVVYDDEEYERSEQLALLMGRVGW